MEVRRHALQPADEPVISDTDSSRMRKVVVTDEGILAESAGNANKYQHRKKPEPVVDEVHPRDDVQPHCDATLLAG